MQREARERYQSQETQETQEIQEIHTTEVEVEEMVEVQDVVQDVVQEELQVREEAEQKTIFSEAIPPSDWLIHDIAASFEIEDVQVASQNDANKTPTTGSMNTTPVDPRLLGESVRRHRFHFSAAGKELGVSAQECRLAWATHDAAELQLRRHLRARVAARRRP